MQKYRRYVCAPCWTNRQRRYQGNVPFYREKRKEQRKSREASWSPERKAQERERRYAYCIKRKYGITLDEYRALMNRQDGKCAICRSPESSVKGCFHVDHCHRTGLVRGLLCSKCNQFLGLAKDSPEILGRAMSYLQEDRQDPLI